MLTARKLAVGGGRAGELKQRLGAKTHALAVNAIAVVDAVVVDAVVVDADALEVALQVDGGGGGGGHGSGPFHRGCLAAEETKGAVGLHVECPALPLCLGCLFFDRMQLIMTALPKEVQFILALDQITPGINDGPCHLELLCLWSKRPSIPDAYCVLSPRHSSTVFNH